MLSSIIIFVIVIVFFVVFIFYKRDMITKIFSLDVTSSANQFQERIEETADIVIQRLEEQIIHLEELLEEADTKIKSLDYKIDAANRILGKQNQDAVELARPDSLMALDSDSEERVVSYPNDMDVISIPIPKEENTKFNIGDYSKDMNSSERRSFILSMADHGYNYTDIAKITGISKGEIMLLLQLNKK